MKLGYLIGSVIAVKKQECQKLIEKSSLIKIEVYNAFSMKQLPKILKIASKYI